MSKVVLREQNIPTLIIKQRFKSASEFFQITSRRRAWLLVGVGTLSFAIGLSFGISQRKSEIEEYYPLVESEPYSPLNPQPPKVSVRPQPPKINIKIKAVGDVVPGTNYPRNRLHPQKEKLFQAVKPSLRGADFLFGNFEGTLTNYPFSTKGMGGMMVAFRSPPSYNRILKEAGFDLMSVANNHSFDFNTKGLVDTIHNLEKAGIKALGKKGQVLIAHHKGLSIAWIGFSSYDMHNSVNNLKQATALVRAARNNADIVVISFHAGAEGTGALNVRNKTEYFSGENRGNLVLFSRVMIDSGADLILGHGPHVPRALELYKGKLIAYSLGNFMGYRSLATDAQLAYSLVLEVELNNRGDFISGKIIPIHLSRDGIPYRDRYGRSIKLIRLLTQKNFPKTPLTIANDGRILRKK